MLSRYAVKELVLSIKKFYKRMIGLIVCKLGIVIELYVLDTVPFDVCLKFIINVISCVLVRKIHVTVAVFKKIVLRMLPYGI